MRITDPPEVVALFARILKSIPLATEFEGIIVRSAGTFYANESDFLSGAGAARYGGRWNQPGIRAVYASLDVITATYEAYQNFISAGFSLTSIRPRVTAGATARLGVVCDLTDKAIRRSLGFTRHELVGEDWQGIQAAGDESWTQAIGRGCRAAGFEGLLVPSARHRGGKNIVIFPESLQPGSQLSVLAAEDLPPHPTHWPI